MAKASFEEVELSDSSRNGDSGSYFIQGSYLPQRTEMLLTWDNISYTVNTKKVHGQILKNVSGYANPREILAIMGSSGSGKTSLLSILSNQIIPHREVDISGDIQLNGENIRNLNYNAFARYVMQQDILLPTQTPREALTFAAIMKVGGNKEFIKKKVNNIIEELMLTKVADNLIGNEVIKGISGGEKKRVCIGIELISEPSVLILDEPTSGLDSITALIVIKLLKTQASKGRTIITTIHQPSTKIFQLFDRLILMVEGNFIYQGRAADSEKYFKEIGEICPELTNPPDHYMRMLYVADRNNLTSAEAEKISLFTSTYKRKEKIACEDGKITINQQIDKNERPYHAGFFVELQQLSKRSFINTLRNPLLLFVKLSQALVMGFLLDILFRDLGYGYVQIKNREGLLYFCIINILMFGSQSNSMTFPIERPLFLKDYKEGVYGVNSFFLAKVVAELPAQIIFTLLYVVVVYFATDLNRESGSQFFVFYGVLLLVHIVGCGYGNLAGVISPNVMAATVWGPTIAAPLMMFAGFFSKGTSLSSAFFWIKYLSGFNFGFEALAINELTDLPYDKNEITTPPLETLGFTGELWKPICSLLLIELGVILIVLVILKILGNSFKNS